MTSPDAPRPLTDDLLVRGLRVWATDVDANLNLGSDEGRFSLGSWLRYAADRIAARSASPDLATLTVTDSIKMLRETFSVAQNRINSSDDQRKREHSDRLQRLIEECERQRPTGPDGKHGDRHTATCGCDR